MTWSINQSGNSYRKASARLLWIFSPIIIRDTPMYMKSSKCHHDSFCQVSSLVNSTWMHALWTHHVQWWDNLHWQSWGCLGAKQASIPSARWLSLCGSISCWRILFEWCPERYFTETEKAASDVALWPVWPMGITGFECWSDRCGKVTTVAPLSFPNIIM